MALDPRVQHLIDRMEITDVINRYATGVDLRDWDLFGAIFDDEVLIDFESFDKTPARKMTRDEWVAAVRSLLPGFDSTQHVLTNHVFQMEKEKGVITVYMKAEHFFDGDSITLGGYYTHTLRHNGSNWRITATKLTVTWSRGNQNLFRKARKRLARP